MSATNACEKCGRNYEFVTSGPLGIGGIVRAVHPSGPCVPRVYEPEDPLPREYQRSAEAKCRGCGVTYTQKRCGQIYCEPICRKRLFASYRVKERKCAWCLEGFRTVYRKQVTCGETCRRYYRKRYHAESWLNREVRAYQRRKVA